MDGSERQTVELELALLQRGVDQRTAERERCDACGRTPLIGEHLYLYEHDRVLCELCRQSQRDSPLDARTVHGEAAGHIRLIDRRAA